MVTLFTFFPPDEWRINFSAQSLSLADIENDSWVSEAGIETRCPYFFVCVEILQRIFIELMETDNLFQNSGCPHFCESIINISIKTQRF